MRLRKHLILLTAYKASKYLVNATFKAHALEHVSHVKLVNNRHLETRGKHRKHEGRPVFMHHPHGKVMDET